MKTNYTKGKWYIDSIKPSKPHKGKGGFVTISSGDWLKFVKVFIHWDRPTKEAEANAKLIASAPELLEALKYFEENYPNTKAGELARKAIKKATE